MSYWKYGYRTIDGHRVKVKLLVRSGKIVAVRRAGRSRINRTDANTRNHRKKGYHNFPDSAMRKNY